MSPRKRQATASKRGITLYDVIRHIGKLRYDMEQGFKQMSLRFDALEERLRAEVRGVDDLDFRVQDLEDTKLPERVTKIEQHIGIATS